MASSNSLYSKTEWGSLPIQNRMKAVAGKIENDGTNLDRLFTKHRHHPTSTQSKILVSPDNKTSDPQPKRSSVIDTWRKREGKISSSFKVQSKEEPTSSSTKVNTKPPDLTNYDFEEKKEPTPEEEDPSWELYRQSSLRELATPTPFDFEDSRAEENLSSPTQRSSDIVQSREEEVNSNRSRIRDIWKQRETIVKPRSVRNLDSDTISFNPDGSVASSGRVTPPQILAGTTSSKGIQGSRAIVTERWAKRGHDDNSDSNADVTKNPSAPLHTTQSTPVARLPSTSVEAPSSPAFTDLRSKWAQFGAEKELKRESLKVRPPRNGDLVQKLDQRKEKQVVGEDVAPENKGQTKNDNTGLRRCNDNALQKPTRDRKETGVNKVHRQGGELDNAAEIESHFQNASSNRRETPKQMYSDSVLPENVEADTWGVDCSGTKHKNLSWPKLNTQAAISSLDHSPDSSTEFELQPDKDRSGQPPKDSTPFKKRNFRKQLLDKHRRRSAGSATSGNAKTSSSPGSADIYQVSDSFPKGLQDSPAQGGQQLTQCQSHTLQHKTRLEDTIVPPQVTTNAFNDFGAREETSFEDVIPVESKLRQSEFPFLYSDSNSSGLSEGSRRQHNVNLKESGQRASSHLDTSLEIGLCATSSTVSGASSKISQNSPQSSLAYKAEKHFRSKRRGNQSPDRTQMTTPLDESTPDSLLNRNSEARIPMIVTEDPDALAESSFLSDDMLDAMTESVHDTAEQDTTEQLQVPTRWGSTGQVPDINDKSGVKGIKCETPSFGSETFDDTITTANSTTAPTVKSEGYVRREEKKSRSRRYRSKFAFSTSQAQRNKSEMAISSTLSEEMVTDQFVSETHPNVEAFTNAYRSLTLRDFAIDNIEEVAGTVFPGKQGYLYKVVNDFEKNMSSATKSLNQLVGTDIFGRPKTVPHSDSVEENVAIEVEYVEDV